MASIYVKSAAFRTSVVDRLRALGLSKAHVPNLSESVIGSTMTIAGAGNMAIVTCANARKNLPDALRKAEAIAEQTGEVAAVIHPRYGHDDSVAVMPIASFVALVKAAESPDKSLNRRELAQVRKAVAALGGNDASI